MLKRKDLYTIIMLAEQPCHSQSIAAIIARTGKNNHRFSTAPPRSNGLRESLSRTLHQINGTNWLVFHRVMIQFFYLLTGEDLHLGTKIQK